MLLLVVPALTMVFLGRGGDNPKPEAPDTSQPETSALGHA
jgi:hypothetical protein